MADNYDVSGLASLAGRASRRSCTWTGACSTSSSAARFAKILELVKAGVKPFRAKPKYKVDPETGEYRRYSHRSNGAGNLKPSKPFIPKVKKTAEEIAQEKEEFRVLFGPAPSRSR